MVFSLCGRVTAHAGTYQRVLLCGHGLSVVLPVDVCCTVAFIVFLLQGTLRSALDRGLLKRAGAPYVYPALAMALARDVAAAMLHLHRYGTIRVHSCLLAWLYAVE